MVSFSLGPELTGQYFADLHAGAQDTAKKYRSLAPKDHMTGTSGLGIRAVREHYIVYVPIGNRHRHCRADSAELEMSAVSRRTAL